MPVALHPHRKSRFLAKTLSVTTMSDRKMVICKCIDVGSTLTLQLNQEYYCFPNGPNHFYVSRFPKQGAQFGCFTREHFRETQKVEEPPLIDLEQFNRDAIYEAELIYNKRYTSVRLQTYYIRPRQTHCNFYMDLELTRLQGCFPLHWFTNFKEIKTYEAPVIVEEVVKEEEPVHVEEQLSLF